MKRWTSTPPHHTEDFPGTYPFPTPIPELLPALFPHSRLKLSLRKL